MSWIGKLIGGGFEGIANGVDTVVENFTGDQAEKDRMKHELKSLVRTHQHQTEMSAASVVKAEAKSEHPITAMWRPITMLTFVAIIANNYIVYPYLSLFWGDAPMLEIPADMWDLLKLGLGGYVAGRTVEKGLDKYAKSKAK